MGARESILKGIGTCPVTDAAGSTVRRRDIGGFSVTEGLYSEGDSLPRHCHANPYLTLILSGTYSERHAHREYQRNEAGLHLLPAGEGHENQFGTITRLLRIKIEPVAVQRLGNEHPECLSEPRELSGPLCSWLANRMIREFKAEDDIAPLAMEGVLLELLAESARASTQTPGSGAPSWLRRVRESLEDSYLHTPSLAELAAIAQVHPVHLSREFHRHYRMTVGEYIRKRRVEHASKLLSGSDLTMAEIAKTCGFSDQSHFCALYKKHYGITPAKFRDLSSRPGPRLQPSKAVD